MAIVEFDTLQRLRDMTTTIETPTGDLNHTARPSRFTSVEVDGNTYLIMGDEQRGFSVALIEPTGGLAYIEPHEIGRTSNGRNEIVVHGVTEISKGGDTYIYINGFSGLLTARAAAERRRLQEEIDDLANDAELVADFPAFQAAVAELREKQNDLNSSGAGISVYKIDEDGTPSFVQAIDVKGINISGTVVSSFGEDGSLVNVGGRDLYVIPSNTNGGEEARFNTFTVTNKGKLKKLSEAQPYSDDHGKFDTVSVDGKSFIVSFGRFDDAPMQVMSVT